jgi:hypothetical protein
VIAPGAGGVEVVLQGLGGLLAAVACALVGVVASQGRRVPAGAALLGLGGFAVATLGLVAVAVVRRGEGPTAAREAVATAGLLRMLGGVEAVGLIGVLGLFLGLPALTPAHRAPRPALRMLGVGSAAALAVVWGSASADNAVFGLVRAALHLAVTGSAAAVALGAGAPQAADRWVAGALIGALGFALVEGMLGGVACALMVDTLAAARAEDAERLVPLLTAVVAREAWAQVAGLACWTGAAVEAAGRARTARVGAVAAAMVWVGLAWAALLAGYPSAALLRAAVGS